MKVIDPDEANAHREVCAEACQESPVVVTMGGVPKFELLPIPTDDPDFIDRFLETNEAFRRLAEESRRQVDEGRVSTLAVVRRRLLGLEETVAVSSRVEAARGRARAPPSPSASRPGRGPAA